VSRAARLGVRAGLVLLGLGVVLVAFVAYQLWGTARYEEQAQSHLRGELARQLHHPLPHQAATLTDQHHRGLPPYAKVVAAPRPDPPINQPVGLLAIPKIGILDTIVEGVGEAQLEQGPGHYPGTPLPGDPGNVAIAGHRTTYARPFYNLDALVPGDDIAIFTHQGLFHYTVTGSQVVAPTDVAVLATTPGQATLTLTTCNPRYSAATRLVVTARFDGRPEPVVVGSSKAPPTELAGEGTAGGLGGGSASWTPAVVWGLLTLGVMAAATVAWRRVRGRWRLLVLAAAVPLCLVTLLVCFEHVSLALPGSY
jgi:sortase A